MEMNFYIFFIAALVPMLIGFFWYGPLFGKTWMSQMGFTEESLKDANMVKIFILSYIFSFIVAFGLMPAVIHQMGMYQVLINEPGFATQTGEAYELFNAFMTKYGAMHRTFKHGAIHGAIFGFFTITPVLSIIALFERKGFKYVAINAGYWVVTLAIMGGIICQWAM